MQGPEVHYAEAVIDNGRFGTSTIRFETGRLAKQAAGSTLVTLDEETSILSTTAVGKSPREGFDFFPLTVDVEERMYAAGRIPGSFFRREGRPSTDAVLTCRLIDRPLRPAFKKGIRNEVQVVETVLSINPDDPYDVVAINGASLSTQLSGLPFSGPIGGVRMALIHDSEGAHWVAFPKYSQLENAVFDMVVAGRVVGDDVAVLMVEAEATDNSWGLIKEQGRTAPTEDIVAEGLEAAKPFIQVLCEAQADLAARAGKEPVEVPTFIDYQDDALQAVKAAAEEKLSSIYQIADKQQRQNADDAFKAEVVEQLAGEGKPFEARASEVGKAFGEVTKQVIRQRILRDQVRIDGRGLSDIRQLTAEVEVLPRVHGSAIFERGETQIMGVTTLNMLKMEQTIDSLSPETKKRYMHHYNFPPYS
ncbi:MAG: polyribonucleotide nucleotidyltransferase, partial [Nesterenkonia sp.]